MSSLWKPWSCMAGAYLHRNKSRPDVLFLRHVDRMPSTPAYKAEQASLSGQSILV